MLNIHDYYVLTKSSSPPLQPLQLLNFSSTMKTILQKRGPENRVWPWLCACSPLAAVRGPESEQVNVCAEWNAIPPRRPWYIAFTRQTLTFDFWPIESNHFIREFRSIFLSNLNKVPQGITEILHSREWDGRTDTQTTRHPRLWL